jgi:hypothetical protein
VIDTVGIVQGQGRLPVHAAVLLAGLILTFAVGGCRRDQPSTIQVRVGNGAQDQASFVPETALAEYLELPGERNELRLTLADYTASCDAYVRPGPGQTYVSVIVVEPAGRDVTTGTYAWSGHEAHGGTPSRPTRPFAMPKVVLGNQSHLFPPGGAVRLSRVTLQHNGRVEGVLGFEFAGDRKRDATSLRGNFRAKLCKLNRAAEP